MVQNELQRYVFKIHSARIRKAKWNLQITLSEARRNNELISLAGSQMLRWIDEINGCLENNENAKNIRLRINHIKSLPNSTENKRQIRKLYNELDKLQFKSDYLNVIIDKKSDYLRLCKGFTINGIKYKRLLGTSGGIKNSTIVFINETLYPEITRRIDNGRDLSKKFNPSKLEAYKALTCSAAYPVTTPSGILVVSDYENTFKADVIRLSNSEEGEPDMKFCQDEDITISPADGFGLMSPTLAKQWAEDMGLDYLPAGVNTRFAFNKGMVFTFDFHKFAEEVADNYIVKDAWGYEVDIRNIELVLTTSMVKLWDSYGSCDEYLKKSLSNNYSFGITKVSPKELESERNTNYQFLQSYKLSDEEIDKLISTSKDEIFDVLGGDWAKTILFLKGQGLTPNGVLNSTDDYIKAIMIDPRVMEDPYIQSKVYQQIKGRIKDAKTGVIKVHGNFSIASGDPYALCQHIFGLEITGLLKAGEIYNKYWADCGSQYVACFRAPMSCHNNIRKMKVTEYNEWFKYIDTCTIVNAWDTTMPALNGMDFDGDLLMLTDNEVLVNKLEETPAILCAQQTADKMIPTEDDYVKSNLGAFGNDIGKITNRVTSMYELQSHFDKDSEEYKTLDYRIKCGQLHQQDAIDKIKGIIAKPMPKEWYDIHSILKIEDDDEREFYKKISAEKKPYFMKYIYPDLSKQYARHFKNVNRNCIRQLGITLQELLDSDLHDLKDEEVQLLHYYNLFNPVGTGPCVSNVICWKFENYFDSYISKYKLSDEFDYSILKSGAEYTKSQYYSILNLYKEYNSRLQNYKVFSNYERVDEEVARDELSAMRDAFEMECRKVCPNEEALCDLVLDISYSRAATKKFAWDMCSNVIIDNLLKNNNMTMSFPIKDESGNISYAGNKFEVMSILLDFEEE